MNEDTPVDDDVIDSNSMQHEPDDAASVLARRLADITTVLDVLVEASDDRDKVIDDLLQRVSDLEQSSAARPGS